MYLMILQFAKLTHIATLYCCDFLDRHKLLWEDVVALCCSAPYNVMTSLIVNVTMWEKH